MRYLCARKCKRKDGEIVNEKSFLIVTVYLTDGEKSLAMTDEQVIELAHMLQTDKEPVPLYTETEQLYAVGFMIQGYAYTKYPRVIVVTDYKEDAK